MKFTVNWENKLVDNSSHNGEAEFTCRACAITLAQTLREKSDIYARVIVIDETRRVIG